MRKLFSLLVAVLFAGGLMAATEMTCAQAREAALNGSTEEVVVTGYVTAIQEAWQAQFKNVSFWMADEKDGGKVFEAFRVNCENEADAPAIGDKVKVTGTLTVYKETTPETAQGGSFVIIEKAGGGEEPPVVGDVMTCVDAAAAARAGKTDAVSVQGYVTEIAFAWKDGSMSFWMADTKDGGKVFEAYKCECAQADAPEVGDLVKVSGTLTYYEKNDVPELAAGCTVVIIEKAGGGEEPPVVGDVMTCVQAAAAARAGKTDAVSVQGYVTEIAFAWKDGSMSFWMADTKDGGKVFEAYKCECAQADAPEVGDLVKVSGTLTYYEKNDVPELAAGCTVVIIEKAGGGEEPPVVGDVMTCVDAAAAARAGKTDAVSVQGYVTEIAFAWKDGSMSFWMADTKDGGKVFEAYKCECAQADAPEVGDLVKVSGTLTYYEKNDVPELAAGCTVVIIEKAGGGEQPPVVGDVITCEEAAQMALNGSSAQVIVEGYVTEIIETWTAEYKNVSFWMADEPNGENVFEAFRVNCENEADAPEVGDLVRVTGTLQLYNNIPETKKGGTFVIVEKGEGGGGEEEELFYDYEPEDATNIELTMVAATYMDYSADFGVVELVLADDEDFEAAANWADLEFITETFDGQIPNGTYQINDSEEEGTFFASPGGNDEYDFPSYVGVPAEEEGYYNPYYLISGTVTISENGIEVNATSYFGSTIHIVYNTEHQDVVNTKAETNATKLIRNGHVFIIRENKTFDVLGARVR